MTEASSSTSPREVTGYGFGQLGLTAIEAFLRIHLLKFFVDEVGLSPQLTGLAVALAIAWDAITDPLMGSLSDQSWRGKIYRRVYFIPGALGAAFSLLLLFHPFALQEELFQFFYLLIFYVGLNTFLTIFAVPHSALGGALSFDPHIRSRVFGWRLAFGNLGAILGVALPAVFLSQESEGAYFWSALSLGSLCLLSAVVAWVSTEDRHQIQEKQVFEWRPWRLFSSIRFNTAFLFVLSAYLLATVGIGINGSLALFYYEYALLLDDFQIQSILVSFMIAFTVSIPVWVLLSKSWGKIKTLALSTLALGASGSVLYPILPAGYFVEAYIYALIGGFLVGAVVLLDSLMVDVVDYDKLKTGKSRLGLYFGFWKMSEKMTRAIAVALTGFILGLIGFSPDTIEKGESIRSLAWLFGPGVNLFFVLSGLLIWNFRFDQKVHARIQSLLDRRSQIKAGSPK